MWHQHTIQLRPRARGFHLITDEIEQQLPQIKRLNVGLLHLFVQHTSASLLGSSVSVPVSDGSFNMGTWQGIYLCEHRNHGGSRCLLVTIQGEVS
ncbi:TPA: YjbQ family protein [Vibrio cholerae]